MFELDETQTLTWIDRTYRTERGLRRFLATLSQAQLAQAEVLLDDDTFVVFYPVSVPAQKPRPAAFHFDLESQRTTNPAPIGLSDAQAEPARPQTERAAAFDIVLAGVRL